MQSALVIVISVCIKHELDNSSRVGGANSKDDMCMSELSDAKQDYCSACSVVVF